MYMIDDCKEETRYPKTSSYYIMQNIRREKKNLVLTAFSDLPRTNVSEIDLLFERKVLKQSQSFSLFSRKFVMILQLLCWLFGEAKKL